MLIRNRYLLFAFGIVGLLGATALVVLGGPGSSRSSASDSPELSARFDVLEPSSVASVRNLPERDQAWLNLMSSPGAGGPGSSDSEQKILGLGSADLPSGTALVANIGTSICVKSATGAAACGSEELASTGSVYTAVPTKCSGFTVLGLVPNGIDSIVANAAGSKANPKAVPVTNNVYEVELPSSDVRISMGSDKAQDFTIPLESYAKMNEVCQ